MAKGDIFQNPRTEIPKNSPNITRVDMETSDLGARKSHVPKASANKDMSIVHVGRSGS